VNDIDVTATLAAIGVPLQIVFIDLLLSADNALLIAMAVRALPPEQRRAATLFGTAAAILLRLAMASVVVLLLQVPFLKIVAGLLLLLVAVRLAIQRGDAATRTALAGDAAAARGRNLLGAVAAIVAADAVMSLDNVVAVAAVADGSLLLLGFGLALSIPMLVYGSTLIGELLDRNGLLVTGAGMFLGWIAGSIGASDAAVAPWIVGSAPALVVVVPLACAVFVFWQGRILAPWPDGGVTEGEPDAG